MNIEHVKRSGGESAALRQLEARFDASLNCHFGYSLRSVQSEAAKHLLCGRIAEMQTGEGKTCATALAAAMFVAQGRDVLVATANEYLAERDARWMQPIYQDLNTSVATICSPTETPDTKTRIESFRANVTYGTIRHFGFDFLREGIEARENPSSRASSEHVALPGGNTRHAVSRWTTTFDVLIVDEADSVLIDEARTPMLITSPVVSLSQADQAAYHWAESMSDSLAALEDVYVLDDRNQVALTAEGRRRVMQGAIPRELNAFSMTELLHAVERAITAGLCFQRDQHYIVRDGRVDLVDEYTGRASKDRNLAGGIHQAIEAKEGLALTQPSVPIARMTVQDFVAKFKHVCGLTATAREDRRELRAVYGLPVRTVPTFRPARRKTLPPVVCADRTQKWQRICAEVTELIRNDRAVLIGTRTIEQSESLSAALGQAGIEHERLNANNPERESKIVARAGQSGRVTVATNMAGRGTDIPISDQVKSAGGLHVIVSELHASERIDRQLMGRGARQGDPGTTRTYVSAQDEIIAMAYGNSRADEIYEMFVAGRSDQWLMRQVRRAQRHVSDMHRRQRMQLTLHESHMAESMRVLGLDPNFDPLPDDVR